MSNHPSTDRWPAHNGRFACGGVVAECLPATRGGRYWIITIRFEPSRWICHPCEGPLNDYLCWGQRLPRKKHNRDLFLLPPRHVRKAAKMALRRVLGAARG